MPAEDELKREIEKLERELKAVSKQLNNAIDTASRNVFVKNGQVVPGLGKLHLQVTARSDEIIDRILRLRRALYADGPTKKKTKTQ